MRIIHKPSEDQLISSEPAASPKPCNPNYPDRPPGSGSITGAGDKSENRVTAIGLAASRSTPQDRDVIVLAKPICGPIRSSFPAKPETTAENRGQGPIQWEK